jgi:hypothetical protein
MSDNRCTDPGRVCPVTTEYLTRQGEMQARVEEMHTVLVNGNGLIGRVRTLEADMNQRKGSLRMLKLMILVAGAIPIVIEILRAYREIP